METVEHKHVYILLLALAAFLPILAYAQEVNIFSDNFENYQAGSFPSAGGWEIVWNGVGNSYQTISTAYAYSGTKSFQLWGREGWSAVVQRRFWTNSSLIGYELSLLYEERSSGYQDGPAFFCEGCAEWGAYYGAVLFDHSDGKIKAEDGTVLGTWEPKRWYRIKVILDRRANKYSVWINGELRGQNLPTRRTDTDKINAIALASGWPGKKVYYDDVRVFLTDFYIVADYSAPSTATPGQSISVRLAIRYYFPTTSYIGILIARQLPDGSWSSEWYNQDYNTPRSGEGILSYTASFQAPSQPGTYRYRIRAYYWDGSQWIVRNEKYFDIQVQVAKKPPSLTLFEPQINGLTVTINGVATPGYEGVSITRIRWDWGDGNSEDHWFPATHTYSRPGTYTVTVTAYQSDGLSTTATKTIQIQQQSSAVLRLGIRHTYIGDLKIWVGIEGGKEVLIWNREGGSTKNLYKEWDLFALGFTQDDLPPSNSKKWYVRISDEANGDEGVLEYFRIVYQGQTYESQDHPEIKDRQTAMAWIPSSGRSALPDLTVRSVGFSPEGVNRGGVISVSWTEANIGGGGAGAYRVGVYLGTSEYGRDYLLGSFNRDGLAAGSSKSYTQTFTVPANIPPGVYYVTVFIDDLRAVSESNEDNNIGSSTPRRVIVQEWQTLLTRRTPGPDNTEVVLEVMELGDNKVNRDQWFMFNIEIRDPNGQTPRNVGPFIRGGKLYICYDRRTGPDIYPATRWVLIPPNTEFGWYYTEYRQWGRVLAIEYINAINERDSREIAQQVAINAFTSFISMGLDKALVGAPELWSQIKTFSENMLNVVLSWAGFDLLPEYKDPTYPSSFKDILLNKNMYTCQEIAIVTKPRYWVGTKFEGVTGWSVDYTFIFPTPGTHEIIIWFYVQYDRVLAPDAFVKLPIEERIRINITN